MKRVVMSIFIVLLSLMVATPCVAGFEIYISDDLKDNPWLGFMMGDSLDKPNINFRVPIPDDWKIEQVLTERPDSVQVYITPEKGINFSYIEISCLDGWSTVSDAKKEEFGLHSREEFNSLDISEQMNLLHLFQSDNSTKTIDGTLFYINKVYSVNNPFQELRDIDRAQAIYNGYVVSISYYSLIIQPDLLNDTLINIRFR